MSSTMFPWFYRSKMSKTNYNYKQTNNSCSEVLSWIIRPKMPANNNNH
jgi:hypothetical protein